MEGHGMRLATPARLEGKGEKEDSDVASRAGSSQWGGRAGGGGTVTDIHY